MDGRRRSESEAEGAVGPSSRASRAGSLE